MTNIRDRERQDIKVCLEGHQILLIKGTDVTAVVRAKESILDHILNEVVDEEDRKMVWDNTHPDLTVYDGRNLVVDEARRIRQDATTLPVIWGRKFVIISYIDRPHFSVLPTLLKLIEEPPDHFSVIITTSNIHRVIPTILSRSLQVRVSPSCENEINWWLELRGVEKDKLRIQASGGDLEVAEGMDLEVVKDWHRDWSSVLMGIDFKGNFPTVWSDKLEEATENTQIACWNLLVNMVSSVINRNMLWSEFGLNCMDARNIVQNGWMNKLMSDSKLFRIYSIAKTIIARSGAR